MAQTQSRDSNDWYFVDYYWWGSPNGWTDLDLYDYNNNWVLDDNEVADIVRDTIYADPYISLTDSNSIKVEVEDGIVTLSGKVRNPRTKPLAYADAFWSSGVTDVVSKIEVKKRQRKNNVEEKNAKKGK